MLSHFTNRPNKTLSFETFITLMAAPVRFERTRWQIQSLLPYHLAMGQYRKHSRFHLYFIIIFVECISFLKFFFYFTNNSLYGIFKMIIIYFNPIYRHLMTKKSILSFSVSSAILFDFI